MNSRRRFHETMRYGRPDRVPYLEEGIREETLERWRTEGMPAGAVLSDLFAYDHREEIDLDLEPRGGAARWLDTLPDMKTIERNLNPDARGRLPKKWKAKVRAWRERDHILVLRIHRGFFLTMGVEDFRSLRSLCLLLRDRPAWVRGVMEAQGAFAARLAQRVLADVTVDAAMFVEPIASYDRSLISPRMYRELVLPSYDPILEVLKTHGVDVIILLTFANPRVLIPAALDRGINCLWASETNPIEMDYLDLRREFGKDLRLIGGIDLDTLRESPETIRREMGGKVPPLLAQGGYVPLADGRVRDDIPFEHYRAYRQCLEELSGGRAGGTTVGEIGGCP